MTTLYNAALAYEFVKRLVTPFNKMPAYKYNLIDEKGNFLKPRNKMTTQEKNMLGYFDVLIINLKKWIAMIPGGASRIGTIAAAMLLLRSKSIHESEEEVNLEEMQSEFFNLVEELTVMEDGTGAVNTAGSGDIAGLGVPAGSFKGFPPVTKTAANKYKKANQKAAGPILGAVKRKSPLNESFEDFVSETTTLQYHKELNPKLWDVMHGLKDQVRGKLLQIADAWVAFARIPPDLVRDIVITGGNVNYNYTPNSDIDLHIVVSRNAINPVRDFVDEYLQDKKILWTMTHPDISIYGYPVELYAQDTDELPHLDQGVYSLIQKKWLARPQYLDKNFEDDYHLHKKVDFYKDMIDKMIDDKADSDSIHTLKKRIKQMRSDSISQGGEFSFGNLVFKELRNSGYLDRISNYERTNLDKTLSLEQYWG